MKKRFPDFFRMGTFLIVHNKILVPFEAISSGCNALVGPFQQLMEGPREVHLCGRVNDLRHSLFHYSSIVSKRQSLSLGNNQKSQGARSGL